MSSINDYLQKQNSTIDNINRGEQKSIKEKEEQMKGNKRQVIPIQEIVDLIKPDVLVGMDKREIAAEHNIELGRIVKALDMLKYDKDVVEFRKKIIEEKRKKKQQKREDKNSVKKAASVVVNIETPVEEEPVPEKKQHKITDDIKLAIVADYETGEYYQSTLAEKYGVSYNTVAKYVSELVSEERRTELRKAHYAERNRSRKSKEEVTVEPVVEETKPEEKQEEVTIEVEAPVAEIKDIPEEEVVDVVEKKDEVNVIKSYVDHTAVSQPSTTTTLYPANEIIKDLTEVNKNTYKTVGLINNRHNMGVNTYIFNKVPNNRIFDFDWLEDEVEEFIINNINFAKGGIPTQGLIVKATGLQTAISALIKVCYQLKINLIISHHQITNEVDNMYRQQPIFTEFKMASEVPYTLTHISNQVSKLYLYKSKPADYNNIGKFYEINVENRDTKVRERKMASTVKPLSRYSILASSIEDIMIANALLSKDFIIDRSYYRSVSVREYVLDQNNTIGYSNNVIQTSNF